MENNLRYNGICNRLGIYVFYDKDGIVDDYVVYFLNDLKTVVTDLIVVVNGSLEGSSEEKLRAITNEVIIRENVGYEMKAYEHIFLRYLSKERLHKYTEIVMCNNSFYGPFQKCSTLFKNMEDVTADYWGMGITEWGYFNVVPSFFVVYRSKIIQSDFFISYFEENESMEIADFYDVVAAYEYGICGRLQAEGYKYAGYLSYDLRFILELTDVYVCDLGVPILKRKSFTTASAPRVHRMFEYIEKNNAQLAKMIKQNAEREFGKNWMDGSRDCDNLNYYRTIIRPETIIDFLKKNAEIYIYGAGICAKKIYMAYKPYIDNFKGFIVSRRTSGERLWGNIIYSINELPQNISIVVAVSSNNAVEVHKILDGKEYNCLYINI